MGRGILVLYTWMAGYVLFQIALFEVMSQQSSLSQVLALQKEIKTVRAHSPHDPSFANFDQDLWRGSFPLRRHLITHRQRQHIP